MKTIPLAFSPPMVRAERAGTKTQTRRLLSPQPVVPAGASICLYDESATEMSQHRVWQVERPADYAGEEVIGHLTEDRRQLNIGKMPYCAGDALWIREAFRVPASLDKLSPAAVGERAVVAGYSRPWCPTQWEADGKRTDDWVGFTLGTAQPGRLRPPMFMPRWASRTTLRVTAVRAERLHAITEADAEAEGVYTWRDEWDAKTQATMFLQGTRAKVETNGASTAVRLYFLLWESLHGPGSWARNPWVWVVSFAKA